MPTRRVPLPCALPAVAFAGILWTCPAPAGGAEPPIRLAVDLREAPRRVFHAQETVPVAPGPLRLYYPKWIPGEHGPTGPIADLAGLQIFANGAPLRWERDAIDMYAVHVDVPGGVSSLAIALDYLMPEGAGSAALTVLSWNTVLLYPAGRAAREIMVEPSLRLPEGWQAGTALRAAPPQGDQIVYETVSLETLVDSPVTCGAHYRLLDLSAPGGPPHAIHIVADSAAALDMSAATQAAYRGLVAEGLDLFGGHHYRQYHFLLTLSDHIDSFGLEHHESSDNRLAERTLIDRDLELESAGLLPHEFVHSWNAKYRRPGGLAGPDFQTPMVGDLLWVYEGLTSYLGDVLTARCGLWSPEYYGEALALIAAGMEHTRGRTWRPLGDTTRAAQLLYEARDEGASWRRGVDFYDEGVLIWLEADAVIREQTGGRASLDDFCRRFFGPPSGPAEVRPYTREDLLAVLGEVAAYDWRAFFDERVERVRPEAPLGGITRSGWKLVYGSESNEHAVLVEESSETLDLPFSLGFTVTDKSRHPDHGQVIDVVPGSPAAASGIGPGMRLVAVNGRTWSPDVVRDALRAAAEPSTGGPSIELLMENAGFYSTHALEYGGGERHPHLVRDESRPDILSRIIQPRLAQRPRRRQRRRAAAHPRRALKSFFCWRPSSVASVKRVL